MRHWLVRPELMCRQHLGGEHLECHMFLGSIHQMKPLSGYYSNGLFFGPAFLKVRHREIRRFIRGHQTPLVVPKTLAGIKSIIGGKPFYWYPDVIPTDEQMWLSWHTLMSRCKRCRKKHLEAKREGRPYRYSLDDRFVLRISRRISDSE